MTATAGPGNAADLPAQARVAPDIPDDAAPSAAAHAGDRVWVRATGGAAAAGATGGADAAVPAAAGATGRADAAVPAEAVALAATSLDVLADEDRVLLMLRYADGHEIDELADLVGRSAAVVSVALHRARGRFTAAYAARVFARPGSSDACDAFRGETIARAAVRPVSDAYAAHAGACAWCRGSEDLLRARAASCAASAAASAAPAPAPAWAPAPAPAASAAPVPAPASVRRAPTWLIAVGAVVAIVVVLTAAGGAWALVGAGGGTPTPSAVPVVATTPEPTLAAPPGKVAVRVVSCGELRTDGSLDAGGAAIGIADVSADVMRGLDPVAYALYSAPSGTGDGASELHLAPRYWVCVRLADDAGDFSRVSLVPTVPVLLEKLASAPIVAEEPAGTFVCGAPLEGHACAAALRIHERPSLVAMR